MIKFFVTGIVVFVVLCVGVTWFLAPDSLRFCGDKPQGTGQCKVADAIVVVSGGDTNARTDEGIKLYQNGWAEHIIFSGAAADKSGPSNAKSMQVRAEAAGVPASAILLEEQSETTDANAVNTITLAKQQGYQSLIVVSSGYHMRRVLMEFQRNSAGIAIAAHPVVRDKDWSYFWWLTPWGWQLSLSELVKDGVTAAGGTDQS